jgi:hypothetical protein
MRKTEEERGVEGWRRGGERGEDEENGGEERWRRDEER